MTDQISISLNTPGDGKPTGEPDAVVSAPFGALALYMAGGRLAHVIFLQDEASEKEGADAETREVVRQLKSYLADPGASFDIRLDLKGSPFQRQVWKALQQIPVGALVTYGDIAEQLDSSARAVGGACRANPVPIVVPCHRVVSAQGLGGFSGESRGYPIETKRWLLVHEGALLM
jgi:methylated-DNA-[protein]-cysteine S-methyltransferase